MWTPNFRGTRRQETRARLRPFGANGRRHTWQGKRTAQRSANVSTSRFELAEYLRRAAAPHDATLAGAAPQFTLLATALAAHVGKLREIRDLV